MFCDKRTSLILLWLVSIAAGVLGGIPDVEDEVNTDCQIIAGTPTPVSCHEIKVKSMEGFNDPLSTDQPPQIDDDFVILSEEETAPEGEGSGDNLTALPPQANPRRWTIAIVILAVLTVAGITYMYRSHLPSVTIPSLPFSIPYISFDAIVDKFRPLPTYSNSKRYRPAPNSLLRWTMESDPSNRRRQKGSGSRAAFLGDLEDTGDYEEVGLLPSPSPYRSTFADNNGPPKNYGAVQ